MMFGLEYSNLHYASQMAKSLSPQQYPIDLCPEVEGCCDVDTWMESDNEASADTDADVDVDAAADVDGTRSRSSLG